MSRYGESVFNAALSTSPFDYIRFNGKTYIVMLSYLKLWIIHHKYPYVAQNRLLLKG